MIPFIEIACIYLVLSAGETLILHWLCNNFLRHENRFHVRYTLGLLLYFLFQLASYVYKAPLFSMAVFYYIFTLLICYACFSEPSYTKVLVAHLFVLLNYACKLLSAVLLNYLAQELLPEVPNFLVQSPLAQISACVLFFSSTLLFILFRNLRKQNKQVLYRFISFLVPGGILFCMIHIFKSKSSIASFYLDISVILFGTAAFLFYLIDDDEVIDEESQKAMIANRLIIMQSNYWKKVEEAQREITSLRHDLKKHLQALVVFIKSGQQEEALDYIENIYESANNMKIPLTGGNNLVNILINNSEHLATEAEIPLTANIMVPSELPFENTDLCIILGNLLDNALEACKRMETPSTDRFIRTEIRAQKAFLIISISNSYNGQLSMDGEQYKSVKSNEKYCGIGLSNVATVLEKYNGDIKISHDSSVFTVTVMLPLTAMPKISS